MTQSYLRLLTRLAPAALSAVNRDWPPCTAIQTKGVCVPNRSARAIRSRFEILFENDGIDPQRLAGTSEEELRKAGLSLAKARCLRSLAEHVLSDKINFLKLDAIDDEAVIGTLTQVKGIGRWTAEMYLMF